MSDDSDHGGELAGARGGAGAYEGGSSMRNNMQPPDLNKFTSYTKFTYLVAMLFITQIEKMLGKLHNLDLMIKVVLKKTCVIFQNCIEIKVSTKLENIFIFVK